MKLTCEESFRRLDDFVDRELTAEERSLVQEHLDECATCAAEFDFEATLIDALRDKLQRIEIPATLRANISARLARERNHEEN